MSRSSRPPARFLNRGTAPATPDGGRSAPTPPAPPPSDGSICRCKPPRRRPGGARTPPYAESGCSNRGKPAPFPPAHGTLLHNKRCVCSAYSPAPVLPRPSPAPATEDRPSAGRQISGLSAGYPNPQCVVPASHDYCAHPATPAEPPVGCPNASARWVRGRSGPWLPYILPPVNQKK